MTTVAWTRKKRGSWSAIVPTVLAVVAMVFGVLALASPASAALVCPDGYTLNGTVCEAVETTPATAVTEYSCDAGYTLVGDGETATCDRYVDGPAEYTPSTPTYVCEADWTLDGTTCSMTVPGHFEHVNRSYHSAQGPRCMNPDVWTLFQDTDGVWKCGKDWVPEHVVTEDAIATAPYTCDEGWTLVEENHSNRCTEPIPLCSRATQVLEQEEPWQEVVLTCPANADPSWTLDVANELCVRTLTVMPTDDSAQGTPGGSTPVVDYCPNIDGVQWEGYDCNTGVAAPEDVVPVTVVEPATVTDVPESVVLPEAATVPAKPAKATVPATVPAGDGSSIPSTPPYVLALLALGATALAASTVRLIKIPTR